ncbi:MAG: DUF1501 domain-containing protein [Candidatus Hydrogenedens sp.]|nr:DUF1501 domain-containing protein [Candidatus Hydrogenedens sp.]
MKFDPHPACPCPGPSRRAFLKVGMLGGLGLTLGDYFRLSEAAAETAINPKAQSVIYIFMAGGMTHLETFDPKPNAPLEIRGELGAVKTNTGEYFGGKLERLAGMADKLAVVRSMTHGEAAHERGIHNMLTGYRPSPAIAYPSYGSVVAHEFGPRNNLPPYIAIPNSGASPYFGTGYLSAAYGAFDVGGEPSDKNFEVRDLGLPGGISPERFEKRKGLLSAVDSHFRELESSDALDAMDSYYQRAYGLISSQSAREAFNMAGETDEMKARYGNHAFGQRLLLSRRLVEAGARFITVVDGGWDHHKNIKGEAGAKLSYVDEGLATLLADLSERGLLESTLVVMATEFGRTSRLNADGGRDHWPKAFSLAMSGGGIQGGQIYGETDFQGGEPTKDPVGPADVAATIYQLLGIPPEKKLMSPGNRPIDLVRDGGPVARLMA